MRTRVLKIDPRAVPADKIRNMAAVLSRGGVIVYPTETYYALGADCYLRAAINKIFLLKRRMAFKPLPVIISDIRMAKEVAAEIPPLFDLLSAAFWPGPLTLILKASPELPPELLGPGRTLGMRIPPLAWLRELITEVKHPLVATSANISGRGEIASPQRVIQVFKTHVDLIADGGSTPGQAPSTVVDLTLEKPAIVREGAIPKAKLSKYLRMQGALSI